ncbi:glycogen/starch/alpha-glucan phosphorylase [Alkaliphilus metalliredigens QYMF]|uniref:Alpha-1,4 glucan phosphorylase n=2 Tax=Alkaliphilus TaxID=114627 RepID=A6TSC7_ALKMQ|nr:glycogen/starch/alpha-glucan phosphorylase [Alkaliphilus metalliredigens]ABR49095.1 glycogen/starch/alpha-glucan phosphorylase [Alkaliphilus metalliredigens QYMF]
MKDKNNDSESTNREKVEAMKLEIALKLGTIFGRNLEDASKEQMYRATASVLRDRIMQQWAYSKEKVNKTDGKELYYLSMEFLMGRFFDNFIMNLMLQEDVTTACSELGIELKELQDIEPDPGLGNGGLGRLAACFLDSLATLGYVGHGNGIRFEYGLFKQKIADGYQIELPDSWLEHGNIWEVAKPEEPEIVNFGGELEKKMVDGRLIVEQKNCYRIKAIPYDMPVVGYNSGVTNTLRLWGARSTKHLNMGLFGRGQYMDAIEEKELAEVISKILYPDDNHVEGKSLRLKQQYFFVSASIQSIIRKYKKNGNDVRELPDKVVIHINDTHPGLAIPELMRILMDDEGLGWTEAWSITSKIFAYTNHTILPEALEKWKVDMFKELLPRVYEIIHEINERFCKVLWERYPEQWDKITEMAIISYHEIHMAKLCIVGSFSLNGVAKLHSEILKETVFNDFYDIYPEKFKSITNGVTHRRFLLKANPGLSKLITSSIGDEWIKDASRLKELESFAKDKGFQEALAKTRLINKEALAHDIMSQLGIKVDTSSIFDVHVKRLHEYKRQLLNVLHIMHLYNRLKENPDLEMHPRTFIFSGKAAPGYHRAKLIIKLIHSVAEKVNHDTSIQDKLKVVFLENYCVSLAEKIIPATDVSEQISTAGKEASGTGNMKFMLNGALTIGTLDGANVEMSELVGDDNIFIFGLTIDQVDEYWRQGNYHPYKLYEGNPNLKQILDQLLEGFFNQEESHLFNEIYQDLLYGDGSRGDTYYLLKDFQPYCDAHGLIDKTYGNKSAWWEKSIINIANGGYFSSDRTIEEYSEKIWHLPKHNFEQKM